jgi:hypothetical protein
MKRCAIVLALVLGACSGGAKAPAVRGDIAFRVISEKQNPTSCVDAPDFELAAKEDEWIDVFDRETQCQPERDVQLPDVDFAREAGLAVWWKTEPCLGFTIHTDSVQRVGARVVVSATATGPSPGVCAAAQGTLESFIVLERSDLFDGRQAVRFVLNGTTIGNEPAPAAS